MSIDRLIPATSVVAAHFDGLELSPCRECGIADGVALVETCEPHEAQFWTVYGHFCTGGVEAFEDFPTYREARCYAEQLLIANPHLAKHGIYEPNGGAL